MRLDERGKRILTTHTGSLPRPDDLSELLFARMTGKPCDAARLAKATREAVAETVATQSRLGVDIVSDGEQSKTSFQIYATERLSGLAPITPKAGERVTRENTAFPAFYKGGAHSGSFQTSQPASAAPARAAVSARYRGTKGSSRVDMAWSRGDGLLGAWRHFDTQRCGDLRGGRRQPSPDMRSNSAVSGRAAISTPTVSTVTPARTAPKYQSFVSSGWSAAEMRFMPRKPVATVPIRPTMVTAVSRCMEPV